jgi:hypothetical protein
MTSRRAFPESPAPKRLSRHGRHGRMGRSPLVKPPLAPIDSRLERFEVIAATAIEFLRGAWPELRNVRLEIAAMPIAADAAGIPMWQLDHERERIVLFRVPIERLLPPGHDDALHRRMAVEAATFRAAAEYVGREPWEFDPFDDFGH